MRRLIFPGRRYFSDLVSSNKAGSLGHANPASTPSPFYPKMNSNGPTTEKSRKSSWRPMMTFTLMNAVPLAGIAYYLKWSIDERQKDLANLANLVSLSPKEVASRIESVCKASTQSTIITSDMDSSPVLPHMPESSPLILTSDELINNIDQTIPGTADVFDALSASYDRTNITPLRVVHFGVSAKSRLGQSISRKNRESTLVYTGSPMRDLCVALKGTMTIVEDERLRRFYWRDRWGTFVSKKDDYLLVKFEPYQATIKSLDADETLLNGVTITKTSGKEWTMLS